MVFSADDGNDLLITHTHTDTHTDVNSTLYTLIVNVLRYDRYDNEGSRFYLPPTWNEPSCPYCQQTTHME